MVSRRTLHAYAVALSVGIGAITASASSLRAAEIAAVFEMKYAIATDGRIFRYASAESPFEGSPGQWVLSDSIGPLSARPVALRFTPFSTAGRVFDVITADGNHYRLTVAPKGGRATRQNVAGPVELIGNIFGASESKPAR